MKLFEFAYCPSLDKKINALATICRFEDWGKPVNSMQHPVLHNYVKHTFSKLYSDYENSDIDLKGDFATLAEGSSKTRLGLSLVSR